MKSLINTSVIFKPSTILTTGTSETRMRETTAHSLGVFISRHSLGYDN